MVADASDNASIVSGGRRLDLPLLNRFEKQVFDNDTRNKGKLDEKLQQHSELLQKLKSSLLEEIRLLSGS